ncbi:DUF945 family protein [Rugamonas violacea]|uniref:DUF945 family protein n=1 Tax=Rugamonas sp. CCM 8940 TaxID=2765359 RepID=UPI00366E8A29
MLAPIPAAASAPSQRSRFDHQELLDTVALVADEWRGLAGPDDTLAKAAANYRQFEHGAATRGKLQAVFDNQHPFEFSGVAAGKGQTRFRFGFPGRGYLSPSGSNYSWSALNVELLRNKAETRQRGSGQWKLFSVLNEGSSVSGVNMSYDSKQTRAPGGLWYGSERYRVGTLMFGGLDAPLTSAESAAGKVEGGSAAASAAEQGHSGTIQGLELRSELRQRGAVTELRYQLAAQAVVVKPGPPPVRDVNLKLRILNVNTAALGDFRRGLHSLLFDKLSAAERAGLMQPLWERLLKTTLTQGVVFIVDELSARYNGNKATLKGRVSFDQLREEDVATPGVLLQKMVAEIDLRVPVDLTKDLAYFMARPHFSADMDESKLRASSDGVAAKLIGKLVDGGLARVDRKELRMAIQFKGGKLTANGKPLSLAVFSG